jgi:hypothetical protein
MAAGSSQRLIVHTILTRACLRRQCTVCQVLRYMERIILHGLAVYCVCVCALRGVVLLVGVLGSGLQPFCGLLLSVTGKAEGPLGVWLYLWSVCFG